MPSILRKYRAFEKDDTPCQLASQLEVGQYVRSVSRSLVMLAAFDAAVVAYCRSFFDAVGNEDLNFRHKVCGQLRGQLSFAFLWALYLDSAVFKEHYNQEAGLNANNVLDPKYEPTPGRYIGLVDKMSTCTLLEEQGGGKARAFNQQARLICRMAKEVDLVDYVPVSKVKNLVYGRPELHEFFAEWLPMKMDEH